MKKAKRETRDPNKSGYVDKKKLFNALLEWQLVREEAERKGDDSFVPIPDYVAYSIVSIAAGLGNKNCYSRYTYLDDMIGDAILQCTKYIKNFDAKRGLSPFAYITEICNKTFWSRISTEKKHVYISLKQAMDTNLEGIFEVDADDSSLDNKTYQLEAVEDFIRQYEEKMGIGAYAKKSKAKPKSFIFEE